MRNLTNLSRNGQKEASLLSNVSTRTCVGAVWIEPSNIYGKSRYLSKSKFGYGLSGMILLQQKDNLMKRNWTGNSICQFCTGDESISHLFFNCHAAKFVWSAVGQVIAAQSTHRSFTQFFWWFPQFLPASRNTQIAGLPIVCWAIWKLRNKLCFEDKLIKKPFELISYSTVFMKHWAGLHNERDAKDTRAGVDCLLRLAGTSGNAGGDRSSTNQHRPLRLMDTGRSDEDAENVEMEDGDAANA
jgi:hypothetical protein